MQNFQGIFFWQFVVMWPKLWAWWDQLIQWCECAKGETEGREPQPCVLNARHSQGKKAQYHEYWQHIRNCVE